MTFKIFLKDGQVFGNYFPDEPVHYGIGDEQYYGARMDEYLKAIHSALPVSTYGVFLPDSSKMEEGLLYDLTEGWKVEEQWQIKENTGEDAVWLNVSESHSKDNIGFFNRKIFRIVPESIEDQEKIFDDLFSRYLAMVHGGYSGYDAVKSLQDSFTITRKPV